MEAADASDSEGMEDNRGMLNESPELDITASCEFSISTFGVGAEALERLEFGWGGRMRR